ncbi:OprD family porin [Pseudomonas gingeri]|uniref:OprD family porin n=1 Tax=Pseudomonas gingeri TaxID=117681 RepID=UPI0015A02717|nr:OprD family porin [Pseudomonas gingeri]NWA01914.1 OprD family porin [Pseudomonas gingeri]NWA12560.1 OprD family porin [Pseudomonas gingeri]NWA58336.1 OprD family porin [Pseudomonas gingeri]NWA98196.1 OprD family porin [Pseudomonas gingeri]NWB04680.1 OprD family porin [Pseudomonas gingeri]
MKKSTLALAVAVGVLAQQASAAGFIEDSKATLGLRNYYINTDNRDSDAGTAKVKATGVQSKNEEWGQGFDLRFISGYTQGTVGFGIDAIGLLGVRLDSGRGTNGATSTSYGGTVFPSESNGKAVNDFSSLGLTGKVKVSQTELKIGTLQPNNPVIKYNDGRLLPQTFQGGQITSNEIKDLTLTAGQIEHAKGRNSSNTEGLSIAGANSPTATGRRSNKFYYGGADYKITKDLVASYYYGELKDFYSQNFLGLVHNWSIGPGVLKSDLRYYRSRDNGANGDTSAYFTSGYYDDKSFATNTKGKVDNDLYSYLALYSVEGHTFGAGYQYSKGDSDFPWLNQGDGSSNSTITDMQIQKFARAGERTWQARYAYDFAKVGVPGLTAGIIYLRGNNIDTAGNVGTAQTRTLGTGGTEWERDLTLAYVVPQGTFKNLGFAWKNAMWRNDIPGQRDQDENRLIVSYSIPLL